MIQAERALAGLVLLDSKYTIQEALRVGLRAEDFGHTNCRLVWETALSVYMDGLDVDVQIVASRLEDRGLLRDVNGSDGLKRLVDDTVGSPANVAEYAKSVILDSLGRDVRTLGMQISGGGVGCVPAAMETLNDITGRRVRAENPVVGNPADALERSESWAAFTGLPFLDQRVMLTSGELHFLAGDPGSGKTTCIILSASHAVKQGIPVCIISAETDALEIQLSMLAQTREVTLAQVDEIRYGLTGRSEAAIQRIRDLWNEHYGDVPLSIHKVNGGSDEVIAIVNSLAVPHIVYEDHAFAVVAQTESPQGVHEHQKFNAHFAGLLGAVKRGNHIMVVANQYKLSGRDDTRRGPDAEYGGSGVQNIAGTMIHLWKPSSEVSAAGYQLVNGEIVKVRARLVADDQGRPVDPLNDVFQFYIESRYRIVVEALPVA